MRRTARSISAALLITTAGLLPTAASAADLVYGSFVSPKHSVMRTAMPKFFADIKKATNGAINWKMVAGGQLVDAKGTAPGLKDNLVDGGFLIPPFSASYMPHTNLIFGTQVFGDDSVAATGAALEFMLIKCPQCLAELKKNSIVALGGFATTPFKLMCRIPIAKVADLKGKKIRAVGGAVRVVQLLGATPVVMSPSDATQALQRGGLDCVNGPVAWLRSYGYQDVAKHVVDFPLGMAGPALHIAIARKKWLAMTPQQRKAHVLACAESSAIAAIDGYIMGDRQVVESAKKKGVKFVKGGKDFEEVAAARQKQQGPQSIKQAAKFKLKDPEKLLATFDELLTKWQKLSKDIGLDKAKLTEALMREIYSKVDPEKL